MGQTLGVNYLNPRDPQPTDVGGGDPVGSAARGFELGAGIGETIANKRLHKARQAFISEAAGMDSADKKFIARGLSLGIMPKTTMELIAYDGDHETAKRWIEERKMYAPAVASAGRQLASLAPEQRRAALDAMIADHQNNGRPPLAEALVNTFGQRDLTDDESLADIGYEIALLGDMEAALDYKTQIEEREFDARQKQQDREFDAQQDQKDRENRLERDRLDRENDNRQNELDRENRLETARIRAGADGGDGLPGDTEDDGTPLPDNSNISASGSPDALFGGEKESPAAPPVKVSAGGPQSTMTDTGPQSINNTRKRKYRQRLADNMKMLGDPDISEEKRRNLLAENVRLRASLGIRGDSSNR